MNLYKLLAKSQTYHHPVHVDTAMPD